MKKRINKSGMILPLALTFLTVLTIFLFSMVFVRTETRQENLMTFHYLKAQYMAQAGIQHAMMKIRMLPDEAFEAAARQFGICPLNDNSPAGGSGGNTDLMGVFLSDLRCDDLQTGGTAGWGYEIINIATKAAFRKDNRLVTVVEIESHGWAVESRSKLNKRTEVVKKTVSIFKTGN